MRVPVIVNLLILAVTAGCPRDWTPINDKTCLYFGGAQVSFPQVKVACHTVGGIPVKITDTFINNLVLQQAQNANLTQAYIGVEQLFDLRYWVYADEMQSNLTYVKWGSGEPNNDLYCATIDVQNGGVWKAHNCQDSLPYFCSTDATPDDGSTTPNPVTLPPGTCDQGWKSFGGYCYYMHNFTTINDGQHWDLFNFTDAKALCEGMNATLASIHSQAENDFIYDMVVSRAATEEDKAYGHPCDWAPAWIGMYHQPNPNSTHWVDGSPVDYCDYPNGCIIAEMYNVGFLVHNDPTCFPTRPKSWFWWVFRAHYARYVCKKLATPMADRMFHGIGYE
ncbi:unnamed protein product, partial [Mesorhabditis spiculigera]